MRVAYYYHVAERTPVDHPFGNPYGELLSQALERRGVAVEWTVDGSDEYLHRNRGRIDLVHLNWPHFDYYHEDAETMWAEMRRFVGWLELARRLGYRLVWTAHNVYPHNRRHQEIDHACRLEICRLATAVIAHCKVARAEVTRAFGRVENLFVIPHGHFIGVYAPPGTRAEARARLGVPEEAFAYGFFGNLQPYKGIEDLIACVKELPQDCWLLGAGGGKPEYLERVEGLVAEHPRIGLRTFSRAPSEEITLVLQASDVIALPFAATMTSGTVILALSWPRPVIAPALGCLPMTVPAGAGILYDPTIPGALPRALERIRGFDLEAAAQAGLRAVREFDWDTIGAATLEAYHA